MKAKEMQAITDKVIKDSIDEIIEMMKKEANAGLNSITLPITDAEASWFQRNDYDVERSIMTPEKTFYIISW
jgi:hypothetical protein